MYLEPAIGMVVGLALLGRVPSRFAILGIALVITAGIGATRTGNRPPVTTSPETLPVT
ncbi:hypothetical protein [Crystallibacter degradans]|uniref:hypothetical protein n=1 Tax=Crystallibacter degradans TaxID=2726743 RepID=UPI0014744E4B|nr:hypothetical protein [Arthrobacter sp. SF27]NMR29128.1 hypothetical protein [Arthrobacter sp. SF27]